jgi:hypothetical protein
MTRHPAEALMPVPRCMLLVLALLAIPSEGRAEPAPTTPTPPADLTLLRIDVEDGFALHPWLYHEFRFGERWGLLFDVHAQAPGRNDRFPPYLELDLGPVLHVGGLQVNPQIGIDFVWREDSPGKGGRTVASDFIVELYLIFSQGRLNAESWNLYFIPFDSALPQAYLMRQILTVRVAWGLSLGPHVEGTFVRGVGVDRIALGGDLAYAIRFVLFLASERQRGVMETRLSFIREL